MTPLPLRLRPGDELRGAIESAVAAAGCEAGFVLSGIGSLCVTKLRLAGAEHAIEIEGDVEILTIAGSVSVGGSHLHASVADAGGRVVGGHVAPGCVVRTTAELLLALLPGWRFARARSGHRLRRAQRHTHCTGHAPTALIRDVLDNRGFLHSKSPMTGHDHPNLPQGYVQLTEGRIRTTDLVFGKTSSGWTEPHAFVVGSAVGEDGTKVARRVPAESKSARVRS